jgi:putative membrane protein
LYKQVTQPGIIAVRRRGNDLNSTCPPRSKPVLATIVVILVAVLHILFLVLEMFLWKRPVGQRIFGLSSEFAGQSAALAANQGLYNGFIAAGLLLGLTSPQQYQHSIVFLLVCAILAGVFGAITAKRSILWIQAAPAAIALLLWLRYPQ